MSDTIDLHLHTTHSDGVVDTSGVVRKVREVGLSAFAITDHDSLEGYFEARELLGDGDPELVPGVELSASLDSCDLHILAYLFDPENPELNEALGEFKRRRNKRGEKMVQRLNDLGIEISIEEVHHHAGSAAVGRPHVADALYDKAHVNSYEAAFERYLGNDKPAYVAKVNFAPDEAISLIHMAGGLAVLAHPLIGESYKHIEYLVEQGLDGLEVYHPHHSSAEVVQLTRMADQYGLIGTGGSDFHGRAGRYADIGSQQVPSDCLDKLKEISARKRGHN